MVNMFLKKIRKKILQNILSSQTCITKFSLRKIYFLCNKNFAHPSNTSVPQRAPSNFTNLEIQGANILL